MLGVIVVLLLAIRRRRAVAAQRARQPARSADRHRRSACWLFLLVVIVAGGVREELQRAFLLHRFGSDLGGRGWACCITSLAFGLGHTLQGWDAAIVTGHARRLLGRVYLDARQRRSRAMVSHALFNSRRSAARVL